LYQKIDTSLESNMNANIDSKVLFNYAPLDINNPFVSDTKSQDKESLTGAFAQAVAQSQQTMRVETPSILDPKVPTMTVKAGDSLTGMVKNYLNSQGLSPSTNDLQKYVQDVAHQNGINNPNLIFPGQKLQLASLDASIKGSGPTLSAAMGGSMNAESPTSPPVSLGNASSLAPLPLSSASVLVAKSMASTAAGNANPPDGGLPSNAEVHTNIYGNVNVSTPFTSGANNVRQLQAERMAMARAAMGNMMNGQLTSAMAGSPNAQASLLGGVDTMTDPMGGLSGMSSMMLGNKSGALGANNALASDPFNGVSAANHIQLMGRLNGSAYPVLQKTLDRAVDKGFIPPQDKQAVNDRILQLARQFKFSPDDFAKVSLMESDGLNPKSTNNRCHGIIQFCDGPDRGAASAGFATNPKAILGKSVLEQLDMVGKYFDQTGLKNAGPTHLDDLYLTVLTPAAKTETRTDVGLNIAGPQANYLHVNRDVRAPITRDSIVQGLHQNALDKLGIDERSIKDALATQANVRPKPSKADSGALIASANASTVTGAQAAQNTNSAAMKLSLQRLQALRINAYLNPVFTAGLNSTGASGSGR
jgi:LysM repeat protein